MKPIVETLLELQTILLTRPAEGTDAAAKALELRSEVPSSLLGHFQRQVARGRRAVAVVRNGVCGECHMRLPTGTAASLVSADDLVLCETCSCYLMLAPSAPSRELLPVSPSASPSFNKRGSPHESRRFACRDSQDIS